MGAALVGTFILGVLINLIQRSPAGVRAAIIMMQGLLFLVPVSAAGLAYQGGEAVSGFMSALLFTIQSLMSRIGYKYRPPVPLVQIEAGAHDIIGGVGVLDILPLREGVEPDVGAEGGAEGGGDPRVPGRQLTNEETEV